MLFSRLFQVLIRPIYYFGMTKNFRRKSTNYPQDRNLKNMLYRGRPFLRVVNGVETCNSCGKCEEICPTHCISIQKSSRPDKSSYPGSFELNLGLCLNCGYCESVCPEDAIKLSQIYETILTNLEPLNIDNLKVQRGTCD